MRKEGEKESKERELFVRVSMTGMCLIVGVKNDSKEGVAPRWRKGKEGGREGGRKGERE